MAITQKDLEDLRRDALRWREISKIIECVKPNFSHMVRSKMREVNGQMVYEDLPVYTVDLRFVGRSLKDAIDSMIETNESVKGNAL